MEYLFFGALKLIVALGLLNVWVLRANRPTDYRGGNAASIIDEFKVYGLPIWFCYVVGALKIVAAILFIAALFIPWIARPTALMVAVLMVGALAMHLKVGDPLKKSMPAAAMLIMTLTIFVFA